MTKQEFNKEVRNSIGSNETILNTIYGPLKIRLEKADNIKLYSLFMRFTNFKDSAKHPFEDIKGAYDPFNKFSHKWNLHNTDAEYILDILDERIDNLNYIKNTTI